MVTVATSPAVAVPSTETIPVALLLTVVDQPHRCSVSGLTKIPGFAGTMVTATGVVVTTPPSAITERT